MKLFSLSILFAMTSIMFAEDAPKADSLERKQLEFDEKWNLYSGIKKFNRARVVKKNMALLEKREAKPTTFSAAQLKLQTFMRKQADVRGLTTRDEAILPHRESPKHTSVRASYKLTGIEDQVQKWIKSVHQPRHFQVITKMTMTPQSSDHTRIEVEVEVEKFITLADPE